MYLAVHRTSTSILTWLHVYSESLFVARSKLAQLNICLGSWRTNCLPAHSGYVPSFKLSNLTKLWQKLMPINVSKPHPKHSTGAMVYARDTHTHTRHTHTHTHTRTHTSICSATIHPWSILAWGMTAKVDIAYTPNIFARPGRNVDKKNMSFETTTTI